MRDSALVSILLPTYNHAKHLPISIESVLAQTYLEWEMLIWDDGSTDNTREVINSYNDNRIRYFFDENHGVAYARNRAIEKSNGRYVAFLDSDDRWFEDKLLIQIEFMERYPQIDILFTDFVSYRGKKKKLAFAQNSPAMEKLDLRRENKNLFIVVAGILKGLATDNFIASDTIIVRRELFGRIGTFNEKLRNAEDFELLWRIGLSGACFAYIDQPYLARIKYSDGLSSPSILHYKNVIRSLDICMQESIEFGRDDLIPYLRQNYRNAWQNLIIQFSKDDDKKGVLTAFLQSIRYGLTLGSFRLLLEAFLIYYSKKFQFNNF